MFRQALLVTACAGATLALFACGGDDGPSSTPAVSSQDALQTATPIKHVVVIYGENVSFDHYFGTYPNATNPAGEPAFTAKAGTPSINGLTGHAAHREPELHEHRQRHRRGQSVPPRSHAGRHGRPEPRVHGRTAGRGQRPRRPVPEIHRQGVGGRRRRVRHEGPGDGLLRRQHRHGTVELRAALLDERQRVHDGLRPVDAGCAELIAGQTNGMQIVKTSKQPSTLATSYYINDGQGGLTMINDVDPGYDVCSSTTDQAMMTGKNIGDLLNAAKITWGGFMGGFNLSTTNGNGTTGCARSTVATAVNAATADYIPHHWFQYYASTRTRSTAELDRGDRLERPDGRQTAEPANHQYDSDDFFAAVKAGNFPSVSFLKAPAARTRTPAIRIRSTSRRS
jgi:phospholipase C